MIQGIVNSRREAMVRLKLRGPSGLETTVDVIVDSGFTGALALPSTIVPALGLWHLTNGSARLADGSTRQFDVFSAEVEWDGVWQPVLVSAIGDQPLMGMRLLAGHKLGIEVEPGGMVEITPLA